MIRLSWVGAFILGVAMRSAAAQSTPTSSPRWLGVQFGLVPYGATAPYEGGIAAEARALGAMRVAPRTMLEFAVHALGALSPADAYIPGARALPNSTGASLGVLRLLGQTERLAVGVGAGWYRVAARRTAPGGSGVGVHVNAAYAVRVRKHTAVTFGTELLMLPSIGGGRVIAVPLRLGARVH